MRFPHLSRRRRAVLAVVAVAGTTACLIAAPTRGQQSTPVMNLFSPAAASTGPDSRVTMDFTLPPGVQLQRNPRLRITDATGKLFELLPMFLTPGPSATGGYRDLHTELYPPGVYQVRLEVLYAAPGAKTLTATTPPAALTVPAR